MDMPAYDMVCASLGFGIVGENEQTVLCVPTEKQYEKSYWYYKFTVECECEALRQYIPCQHFYFSDFCSSLTACLVASFSLTTLSVFSCFCSVVLTTSCSDFVSFNSSVVVSVP